MKPRTTWSSAWLMLAVATTCLAVSARMSAQVQTETTTTHGTPTHEVKVEHATVVAVSGNNLVVKMDDGTIRDFDQCSGECPGHSRRQATGNPRLKARHASAAHHHHDNDTQGDHDHQSVTGKVWHVNPPSSVILTMENGENQQFKVPEWSEVQHRRKRNGRLGSEEGHEGFGNQGCRSARDRGDPAEKADWLDASTATGTSCGPADPDRDGRANTGTSTSTSSCSRGRASQDRKRSTAGWVVRASLVGIFVRIEGTPREVSCVEAANCLTGFGGPQSVGSPNPIVCWEIVENPIWSRSGPACFPIRSDAVRSDSSPIFPRYLESNRMRTVTSCRPRSNA